MFWLTVQSIEVIELTLHSKGRRIHVHVSILHHLPHLLVELAIAAHALHHLA